MAVDQVGCVGGQIDGRELSIGPHWFRGSVCRDHSCLLSDVKVCGSERPSKRESSQRGTLFVSLDHLLKPAAASSSILPRYSAELTVQIGALSFAQRYGTCPHHTACWGRRSR